MQDHDVDDMKAEQKKPKQHIKDLISPYKVVYVCGRGQCLPNYLFVVSRCKAHKEHQTQKQRRQQSSRTISPTTGALALQILQ